MNSEERHEVRYQRRKAARDARRNERLKGITFDKVFSYGNLYKAYQKCRRGVSWKASVQNYICQAPLNVFTTWEQLRDDRFRVGKYHSFDLYERGKKRHIDAVGIRERVVQRCLCDYALVPGMESGFVYDSGASIRHKGYDFTLRRMIRHLQGYWREHGNDGYILLFDFRKFFENVDHRVVEKQMARRIQDERIRELTMRIVRAYGNKGLGLGSQISQTLALASADPLDHFIKTVLRCKWSAQYMDDGYIIHQSKAFLVKCLEAMKIKAREYGIEFNEKKTMIVRLRHGFKFLQMRVRLMDNGRILRRICKRSVVRMRQKIIKFRKKMDEGHRTFEDIRQVWDCWSGYAKRFASHHTVRRMWRLYSKLFEGELMGYVL